MQIIGHPKTYLLTLLACGLSSAACAGDKTAHTQDVSFIKADSNEDKLLNREEFKIFAALEAEAGVLDYAAMNEAGNEDIHFSGKDIDGDGLLTPDELAYKVILNDDPNKIKSSYGSSNKAEEVKPHSEDPSPDIEPTDG